MNSFSNYVNITGGTFLLLTITYIRDRKIELSKEITTWEINHILARCQDMRQTTFLIQNSSSSHKQQELPTLFRISVQLATKHF